MDQMVNTLEFDKIIEILKEYAYTENAKNRLGGLKAILSEGELKHQLRETTEARIILDKMGMPPLICLENVDEILITASQGGCLSPEQLEYTVEC